MKEAYLTIRGIVVWFLMCCTLLAAVQVILGMIWVIWYPVLGNPR